MKIYSKIKTDSCENLIMSPKLNEFSVKLVRDGRQTPWGIRIVGGSDLDSPLVVSKVPINR